MSKKQDASDNTPKLPEQDAVKKLKERFKQRQSELYPSKEMDEIIIGKTPKNEKEPVRKIAKPIPHRSDIDLP